jgi:lysophospholipase L1-like esterase
MKKRPKIIAAVLGLVILVLSWPAYVLYLEIKKARSDDPLVWEESVSALEASTAALYGPGEAVIFIGSSSIRFWNTLTEDMSPIPVIQHGFGGAKLNDIVYYADRLVTSYDPRAVVVFAGTNDIDPVASKSPKVLLRSYQAFIARIREGRPDLPVFYIGITPSPLRWEVWSIAQSTNQLIRDWTALDPHLFFIDTSEALLDSTGQPNRDNYKFDGLHLSPLGYQVWSAIIRERLLAELGSAG